MLKLSNDKCQNSPAKTGSRQKRENDKMNSPAKAGSRKVREKFKCQISKQKFWHLLFVICIYFEFCALPFVIIHNVYALNIDTLKVNFLKGDYKGAIVEGEKLIATSRYSADLDELYYILGLSYLKDGNYLRASDIFEIILKEFKTSRFQDEARLSLGDTYFLRSNFPRAEEYYRELIARNPRTKLKAQVYWRLSQCGFKKGDTKAGKEYLNKLESEFPLYVKSQAGQDSCSIAGSSSGVYYTVQVGSFANSANADNLSKKLIAKGYPVYIEKVRSGSRTIYRVKIAKFNSLREAELLEQKLRSEGYPTKICP